MGTIVCGMDRSSEFRGQTTNLLSTGVMAAVAPTDMGPKDVDSASDYDKALSLLKNNPPEQRQDIRLPYCQYLKLEESWSKFRSENNIQEEKRYPSLSYNSLMQIATVIIASSVNEYLSMHKPDVMDTIADYGSTTMSEPNPDDISMSSKEADESFLYERPRGDPRLQVVIECGVSENYKALCCDKDLWIQHLGAKAVVMICLEEAPLFKSPRAAYEDIEDVVGEIERMRQHSAEAMERNLELGNYGPIEYGNHTWTGKLNKLFVEAWRADGKQSVRKTGHSFNPLAKTVGLRISDFFPDDEWATLKIPDSKVRFRPQFFDNLVSAMRLTARMRFIRFLHSQDQILR
ncbi:hypothetical protein V1522DRAFT_438946 [Lipomyces starkeyi]